MIKIGLIGTGFMGSTHAAAYASLLEKFDFKVTAVADLDDEKAKNAAEMLGATIYKTGDELIENADVNTVDICLPTYLHARHAIKAMKKGYNVFIEKPVCISEQEAKELLDVQKETGVNVMVGQCIRFWDEYVYLKNLLDSKEYGEFVNGVFTRISPRPTWAWDGWLHDKEKSGSAALDLHIHDVDYVNYLFGSPDSMKTEISYQNGNPEHIVTLYKYGSKLVTMEGGWDYPGAFPFDMAYRVKFEKAAVVFTLSQSPTVKVYTEGGEAFNPEIGSECQASSGVAGGNISSLGGYYNEMKYFLDCLTTGKKIDNATLEDAVSSFRLASKEVEGA